MIRRRAVIKDGYLLSNSGSQVQDRTRRAYGGVVPELSFYGDINKIIVPVGTTKTLKRDEGLP